MNRFGKYQVVEKIAQGGMAEVFMGLVRVRDGSHRLVALKRLNLETVQDEHIVTMFEDEARVTSRIKHPNIVRTHEFFTDGDNKVLSMEFIPGCDGRTVIERAKRSGKELPELMAITIVRDICLGLEHAHSMTRSDGSPLGLIHRDISPHNMLVGYNGKTKIIDFGIVKSEVNISRTLAGAMKGKFAYMAPEQIMSKKLDHRVDVFALTASLFELLTSQRAFDAPNDFAVLEKIRLGEWGPLPEGMCVNPSEMSKIIAKGLAGDAEDRFDDILQLRRKLDSYLEKNFADLSGADLVKAWMRHQFANEYAHLKSLAQSALQRQGQPVPRPVAPAPTQAVAKEPHSEALPSSPTSVAESAVEDGVPREGQISTPTMSFATRVLDDVSDAHRWASRLGYSLVAAAVVLIGIGLWFNPTF